ncbi:MAG: hypothetical protein MUQ00_12450 [Candidatus Aminicenantes bacterium]|nr:hypothetical protein [Candidatus Aminicenantes bacterium]
MPRKRKQPAAHRIGHEIVLQHKQSATREQTPPPRAKEDIQKQQPSAPPEPEAVTNHDLITSILAGFGPEGTDEQKNTAKGNIRRYLEQQIEKHPVASQYNMMFLYDETKLVKGDADSIYAAVTKFQETKPILLILHSIGGLVEPAYLIGKLLYEYSGGKLEIVVPRRAKSAATLLCCAANHIHMGSLSELGPIDPQFEGLPALGLKSSIQHIAELVAEYPHATDLFSKYMSQSIPPIYLGYYERVAESAVQYAERLLSPHAVELAQSPEKIAKNLVYSYKDHSFVIDKQEARSIFGNKIVRHNTEEYKLGNAVYQEFVLVTRIADLANCAFYMIGSIASDPGFLKRKK